MGYFITGIVVLMVVTLIGLVGTSVRKSSIWMDDSWRWGGKDV